MVAMEKISKPNLDEPPWAAAAATILDRRPYPPNRFLTIN